MLIVWFALCQRCLAHSASHQIKTNCITNTRMRSVLVMPPQGFLNAVCRCRCRRLSSTLTLLSTYIMKNARVHFSILRKWDCPSNGKCVYLSFCVHVPVCVCRTFPVCKAVFLDFTTVGLRSYVPAPFEWNEVKWWPFVGSFVTIPNPTERTEEYVSTE